ncbi:MAG: pilus assembly protein TadG-related protein [Actinomycetota bacterium]
MGRQSHNPEAGYVVPMTALLLVPLMLFSALAVDVGGWTVQANDLQSAADAAALAGAALLPEEAKASAVAREVAGLNGYTDGVDDTTIVVEYPDSTTIRVVITHPADRYFSGVVNDSPLYITRYAEASSLSAVGIGSPTNVLGFGPYSLGGSPPANYWMLENNDCSTAHWGDIRAARYLSSPWCGDGRSLPLNPAWKRATDGRTGGYFYRVEIPPGLTTTSRLMIMDPGKCPGYGSKPADGQWSGAANTGTIMEWRRWDANATPLITSDETPITGWWGSTECLADLPYPSTSWTDQSEGWTETPFVFPANTTGETEYHLIQSRVLESTRQGWNHHSLWVRPDNGVLTCSTIGTSDCPTISAEDWIPTQASGTVAGDPMLLYLADAGPEYAGRIMQVKLWDPGEGMDNIQVIDPLGNALDFTWESDDTVNHGSTNPSDDCSGNPCLDLDPDFASYPPKLTNPGWGNHWRFNGRLVTLNVPLDSQVDFPAYAASGNGYWFQIRFQPRPGNVAREWASFSVGMSGDPIRLTD